MSFVRRCSAPRDPDTSWPSGAHRASAEGFDSLDDVDPELSAETVARYFPYLASEMRAAGLEEDADRLLESRSSVITIPTTTLNRILDSAIDAGLPMAFEVAYRLRVLTHASGDRSFAGDSVLRSRLDELHELLVQIPWSAGPAAYSPDEAQNRLDELFGELEAALGRICLFDLLGVAAPPPP